MVIKFGLLFGYVKWTTSLKVTHQLSFYDLSTYLEDISSFKYHYQMYEEALSPKFYHGICHIIVQLRGPYVVTTVPYYSLTFSW